MIQALGAWWLMRNVGERSDSRNNNDGFVTAEISISR
jgi:hypothetical protein